MSSDKNPVGCDPVEAADFLRALAHPARLQILCRLHEGEAAVSTFEAELGLRQPSLSQQLGLLREAGLVATRREAKSVYYRLADDKVRAVLAALHTAFGAVPAPRVAAPRPMAGQRLTALPVRIEPPKDIPPRPRSAAHGECGVFSVAGWNVTQATK